MGLVEDQQANSYLPLIAKAGLLAGFAACFLFGAKPASAEVCGVGQTCYTFNNAVANDTINQNTGSATITGSFNVPTGTSFANRSEADVTLTLNNPPGPIDGSTSYFFNFVYFGTVGSNNALIFGCEGPTCTGGKDYDPNDPNADTYQLTLGFTQTINFATGPFPTTIDLASLNNGNINQFCANLDSEDLGTNSCSNGENNRFELDTFNAGSSLTIPAPLSSLALAPLAFSVSRARKRYRLSAPKTPVPSA